MMIEIVIDGQKCSVKKGTTILEAAKSMGIRIPTMCYHPGLSPSGNCRLCSVEINEMGKHRIVMSCMFPIENPGLEVITFNERIKKLRSFIVKMLLLRNPDDPALKSIAREYGIEDHPSQNSKTRENKCILCGLCISACEASGSAALSFINRGHEREVATPFGEPSLTCTGCGACAEICPVNFIEMEDKNGVRFIWGKIFALAKCRICGKYFATFEQLAAASGNDEPELLCMRCKQLEEARIIGHGITTG